MTNDLNLVESALNAAAKGGVFTLIEANNVAQAFGRIANIVLALEEAKKNQKEKVNGPEEKPEVDKGDSGKGDK